MILTNSSTNDEQDSVSSESSDFSVQQGYAGYESEDWLLDEIQNQIDKQLQEDIDRQLEEQLWKEMDEQLEQQMDEQIQRELNQQFDDMLSCQNPNRNADPIDRNRNHNWPSIFSTSPSHPSLHSNQIDEKGASVSSINVQIQKVVDQYESLNLDAQRN